MYIDTIYPFTRRWAFGLFTLLGIVNAMNMHVQVFVGVPVFDSLRVYVGVDVLGRMVILCLMLGGTAKLFSTAAAPSLQPR